MEQLIITEPVSTYYFHAEQNQYIVIPVFAKNGVQQLVTFVHNLFVKVLILFQSLTTIAARHRFPFDSVKNTVIMLHEFAKNMPLTQFDKYIIAFVAFYWIFAIGLSAWNHIYKREQMRILQIEQLEHQLEQLKKQDAQRQAHVQWLHRQCLIKNNSVGEKEELGSTSGILTRSRKAKQMETK